MKTTPLITLFCLLALHVSATHLMGGYIQVRKTASPTLEYEYHVRLFLDTNLDGSRAQETVLLCFGDGTSAQAVRVQQQVLEQNKAVSIDTYRVLHTYAGPGTYTVLTRVDNRSISRNMPSTANASFVISTTLSTNPLNSTPMIGVPANGFRAVANQRTIFNLQATDADGDSLVYALANPLISGQSTQPCNQAIASFAPFQFPNDITRRGTFKLNSGTGELIWDAPVEVGRFTMAMVVEEWRNGVKIGTTGYEVMLTVEDKGVSAGTIPPYEPAYTGIVITGLEPDSITEGVQVSIYPNPTPDRLQVRINSSAAASAKLQLTDVNGSVVTEYLLAKPATEHVSELSLSQLPQGMYLLRTEVSGRSHTRKIVKH